MNEKELSQIRRAMILLRLHSEEDFVSKRDAEESANQLQLILDEYEN